MPAAYESIWLASNAADLRTNERTRCSQQDHRAFKVPGFDSDKTTKSARAVNNAPKASKQDNDQIAPLCPRSEQKSKQPLNKRHWNAINLWRMSRETNEALCRYSWKWWKQVDLQHSCLHNLHRPVASICIALHLYCLHPGAHHSSTELSIGQTVLCCTNGPRQRLHIILANDNQRLFTTSYNTIIQNRRDGKNSQCVETLAKGPF